MFSKLLSLSLLLLRKPKNIEFVNKKSANKFLMFTLIKHLRSESFFCLQKDIGGIMKESEMLIYKFRINLKRIFLGI